MITKRRVPYITAWSEETMNHALAFEWAGAAGGLRLTYADPHPNDWLFGVLWVRQGLALRGKPEWKLVNALRQRRCMLRKLCQVCGSTAVDSSTGRAWWVLADGPTHDAKVSGYTNAPPTCFACIPEALTSCPRLRRGAAVYTVGDAEPYGVVADLFAPSIRGGFTQVERNTTLGLDEYRRLEWALAKQLLVCLRDPEPWPGIGLWAQDVSPVSPVSPTTT